MRHDVAVIGMAGVFPDAPDLNQFHQNLLSGLSSIRNVSRLRRWFTSQPQSGEYRMAALDRIDLFDNDIFGISDQEALTIDPSHRLSLELAWQAVEDSATRLQVLQQARTGVFLSATPASTYGRLGGRVSTLGFVGGLPAAVPGRVSYHLGLTGPSMVVDTGCSASLVAVGAAMDALQSGRCEYALAGGVSVRVHLPENREGTRRSDIMAEDGICRSFDAAATGAGDGEGGAVLLLKPLEAALADHDAIHAVIRAVGVNHNGRAAVGITAPAPSTQEALLCDTWRLAGVDPERLDFVEAHGSGTRLGDAVELTALSAALRPAEGGSVRCVIGSVKSNIGHLDHAAGIAGLCKAILSTKHAVVYPSLHYTTLNPDAQTGVWGPRVQTSPLELTGPERLGAVSSFGLTGTNAHAVVQSPPTVPSRPSAGRRLTVITISAPSADSLKRYCDLLADHVDERPELRLGDIARTLNGGRADRRFRVVFTVHDTAELVRAARAAAEGRVPLSDATSTPVVVVFPDEQLGTVWDEAAAEAVGLTGLKVPAATGQRAIYDFLLASGVRPTTHLAAGRGHEVLAGVRGRTTPAGTGAPDGAPVPLDRAALAAAVERLREHRPLYVVLGTAQCEIGAALIDQGVSGVCFLGDAYPSLGTLIELLGDVYRHGGDLHWDVSHQTDGWKVHLPSPPLDRTRHWPLKLGEVGVAQGAEDVVLTAAAPASTSSPGDVETAVMKCLSQVLRVPADAASDYFSLGGNSIMGLQLVDRIQRDFHVAFSLADLYFNPGVNDLTRVIIERQDARMTPTGTGIEQRPDPGRYRLSFGQESLWFMQKLEVDGSTYNVTIDMRLRGAVDVPALHRALSRLVARHEVLRSRYVMKDGNLVAVVDPPTSIDLPMTDLTSVPPEDVDTLAESAVKGIALEPYDLAAGPLYRAALVRLAEDDHVLVFGTHHSVDDGWSPAIVDRELSDFYEAETRGTEPDLPPLPIQYGDYAEWQRSRLDDSVVKEKQDFWAGYLRDSTPLELPGDRGRPARLSNDGGHVYLTLSPRQMTSIRQLAHRERTTPFTVVLAAFNVVLGRYSGIDDLVVGTIVAGREMPETRDLIGYFNNMIAVRTDLSGHPSFRSIVRRVRDSFLSTLEHHDLPFTKVVEAVRPARDLSRHPIFQVGFTYQNMPRLDRRLSGLARRRSTDRQFLFGLAPNRTPWDLNLTVWDVEGRADAKAVMEYATDLFRATTIEQMAERFTTLLDEMLHHPDVAVEDLHIVSPQELAATVDVARRPPVVLEAAMGDDCHPLEVIASLAADDPARPAVIHDGAVTDYRSLAMLVTQVVTGLADRGIGAGDVVAFQLPAGLPAVAVMLASWVRGAAYLPIPAGTPGARIDRMLTLARARTLVTADDFVRSHEPVDVVTVAFSGLRQLTPADPVSFTRPTDADMPAYVVFTSGSTGVPKGVLMSHGGVRPFVRTWRHLARRAGGPLRVLTMANPAFDVFTGDVLRSLATGGCLVIPDAEALGSAEKLVACIREQNVTMVELLPSYLRADLVQHLRERGKTVPSLRILANGLEVWREAELRTTIDTLDSAANVVNVYGVTEAGIDSCCLVADQSFVADDEPNTNVAIGRPYPGVEAYVLDAALQPVPAGVPAELYLGGEGLSAGYLGAARLTADRFLPNPFHGPGHRIYRTGDRVRMRADASIEFLGRVDHQMKVLGYRIEPAEVEMAIESHPAVAEAVVRSAGSEGQAVLVAFLKPAGGTLPTSEELSNFVKATLPEYMTPRRFQWIDAIPLTANGKIDTAALDASLRAQDLKRRVASPRDITEMRLVSLFQAALNSRDFGATDHFFERGGHSLLAIRLLTSIEAEFAVHVPVTTLFERPTPGRMADLIRSGSPIAAASAVELSHGAEAPIVLLPPSGGNSLCYYHLANHLRPARRVIGLQAPGLQGEAPAAGSVVQMVERYADTVRRMVPSGPLIVGGWSLGGQVAAALAANLADEGREVPLSIVIDSGPANLAPEDLPADDAALLQYLLVVDHDFVVDDDKVSRVDGDTDRLGAVIRLAQDGGFLPPTVSRTSIRHLLAVLRSSEEAIARYRPVPHSGEILLVRTRKGPEPGVNTARDLGWGDYALGVTVRYVSGNHYNVVPAQFRQVADAISRELKARNL